MGFQSQMVIQVSRLTRTPPTNPTLTITPGTLALALIWDGVVTRDNITITITKRDGVTIGQSTVTRAIEIVTSEVTSVDTTINTTVAINTKATRDVTGEGKSITRSK